MKENNGYKYTCPDYINALLLIILFIVTGLLVTDMLQIFFYLIHLLILFLLESE